MPRTRRALPLAALGLFVVAACWAAWRALLGGPAPAPRPAPPGLEGRAVPTLEAIAPGLIVDENPPDGWSHRIVLSTMALVAGDLASVPDFARDTATRFRTVILADVRPSTDLPGGYALRRVGVGLAVEHEGHDVVVSSESADRLGIEASLFDKLILGRAEAALARGRLAARTPTFALYDASLEMTQGEDHRSVFLRYAMLADPETGELTTVVWPVAEEPADRRPARDLIRIEPGLHFQCDIHVNVRQSIGPVPVSWGFAMMNLPPGRTRPMPPELQAWSIRDPATAEESAELEEVLRRALEGRTPDIVAD